MSTTQPSDEVSEITQVATPTYKRRQKESFEFVGGGPTGWRASPILNVTSAGSQIEFDIPPTYREVKPYEQMHPEAAGGGTLCELCGWEGIVEIWYIQEDNRRLFMRVGSVCVDTFMGAKFTAKTVKIFKETKLRNAYTAWRQSALAAIMTHDHGYWLPRPYYQLKIKITKSEPETTSSRIITNIFKKARELNIPIPADILPDQTPEETEGPTFRAPQPTNYGQVKQTNGVKVWLGQGAQQQAAQASQPKPTQTYRLRFDAGRMLALVGESWVPAVKSIAGVWTPC